MAYGANLCTGWGINDLGDCSASLIMLYAVVGVASVWCYCHRYGPLLYDVTYVRLSSKLSISALEGIVIDLCALVRGCWYLNI